MWLTGILRLGEVFMVKYLPTMISATLYLLAATILTNTTDLIESLLNHETGRRFELSAQAILTAGAPQQPVTVRDGQGVLTIADWDPRTDDTVLAPGDKAILSGEIRTALDASGTPRGSYPFCTGIVRLGSGEPPAALPVRIDDLRTGRHDNQFVTVGGTVLDVFLDEISPDWSYLTLSQDGMTLFASFRSYDNASRELRRLLGAEVTVSGLCLPQATGVRRMVGRMLRISGPGDVRVVTPPPADPFDIPLIDNDVRMRPLDIYRLVRRRTRGHVVALWHGNHALVRTPELQFVGIEFSGDERPDYGSFVEAVGFTETDMYRINLNRVRWRPAEGPDFVAEPPRPTSAKDILTDEQGRHCVNIRYHGSRIALTGTVKSILPGDGFTRIMLDDDGFQTTVELNMPPPGDIAVGCRLRIAGTCIIGTEKWHPYSAFPRIESFLIAVNDPADLIVLSRPPWLTAGRLLIVVAVLLATLLGAALWIKILSRMVERRGRQLAKEEFARERAEVRVQERTSLAIELHDSLSQDLTGVSLRLDAVELAARHEPSAVLNEIAQARGSMRNCRDSLRNCLRDMRSGLVDTANFSEAVRETLLPIVGKSTLSLDCNIPGHLPDRIRHSLICIIREIATNAVRHGKANRIDITGTIRNGRLNLRVRDNGLGFDPDRRPGVGEGHFGLQGVAERVRRLDGEMQIDSRVGGGTDINLSNLRIC